MTTLLELRQAVGRELDECLTGTVTSASETTLVDEELVDADESPTRYEGHWLLVISGAQAGTVRRVADFAGATGTLSVSRAWAAPAKGDGYELHGLVSPDELRQCIGRGLARCSYLAEAEIAAVGGQRQYGLATIAWLTRPAQVVDVVWRTGVAGQYSEQPLAWYAVRPGAGGLTLDVPAAYATGAGERLVLRGIAYYQPLAADTDESACPAAWARGAALLEVYRLLTRRAPAADASRYEGKLAQATAAFRGLCRGYQPRAMRRLLLGRAPQS